TLVCALSPPFRLFLLRTSRHRRPPPRSPSPSSSPPLEDLSPVVPRGLRPVVGRLRHVPRARTRISGIVRDPRLDMFQDQCRLQVQALTRSSPFPFYTEPFLDAEEEVENRACWSRNTSAFLAPFPSGSFVIVI
ncbi:hypothetical protein MUK42_33304, partial [Musa troglodytarum]